ncbi:neuronal acetylcholine receptor subunit alpha-9-like [Glandiceps talaboti]
MISYSSCKPWLLSSVIVFLAHCCCQPVASTTESFNDGTVLNAILQGYDKRIRPVIDNRTPTNVTIDISISHVVDVYWKDQFLQWRPEDYGGIDTVHLPASDICLGNAETIKDAQLNTAIVSSNGSVIINWKPITVTSICHVDVKSFPRDDQTCNLTFVSWGYSHNDVHIYPGSDELDESIFETLGEWKLIGSGVARNPSGRIGFAGKSDVVVMTIVVSRESALYEYSLIIPCILLSVTMCFTFFIPNQYGNAKITVGVTLFLSGFVFMLPMTDKVIATSNSPPVIATGYNVGVLAIRNIGQHGAEVPDWLLWITCCCEKQINTSSSYNLANVARKRHGERRNTSSHCHLNDPAIYTERTNDTLFEKQFGEMDNRLNHIEYSVNELKQVAAADISDAAKQKWNQVANILDGIGVEKVAATDTVALFMINILK